MSVGGKTRTGSDGEVAEGWDHDPPAKQKLTPFGILMVATGALMLIFSSRETSDAWADALTMWWRRARAGLGHVKRLVIYLDNGPKNSGRRTQFLRRMVEFADWSGWGTSGGWCSTGTTGGRIGGVGRCSGGGWWSSPTGGGWGSVWCTPRRTTASTTRSSVAGRRWRRSGTGPCWIG